MTTTTETDLAALFDRYASITIGATEYTSNPDLREYANVVLARGGFNARDVTPAGMTVYRDHAILTIFDLSSDGRKWLTGDNENPEVAKRTVRIDLA